MTWRTFFYLLVVSFGISVTAFTASSEVLAESPAALLGAAPLTTSLDDAGSRWILLTVGIGTVILTYRQAYLNFRR